MIAKAWTVLRSYVDHVCNVGHCMIEVQTDEIKRFSANIKGVRQERRGCLSTTNTRIAMTSYRPKTVLLSLDLVRSRAAVMSQCDAGARRGVPGRYIWGLTKYVRKIAAVRSDDQSQTSDQPLWLPATAGCVYKDTYL